MNRVSMAKLKNTLVSYWSGPILLQGHIGPGRVISVWEKKLTQFNCRGFHGPEGAHCVFHGQCG